MLLRSVFRYVSLSMFLAASAALTGCGAGSVSSTPGTVVDSMHGIAHGGPNPVAGASVTLYATTSGGYGATATPLGTAVTGNDGSFTFVAPLTCTSGQQAYITAQGGNAGAGLNPQYLLMAALGPCSTISASTTIWIDEVTTVAAAEALRPFTTISSTGGVYTVNVGAPANNNATTGVCTVTGTVTTGCVAAGLTHAFANALNLVNSVSIGGVAPTGLAYAVAPSNPNSNVPQALIHTIANSLEACVNSNGGASGDGSLCGNLFAAATPPTTGATAPANTLQAALNIAQYPANNTAGLYAVVPPTAFYQPTLAAAPTDFSVAITYTGVPVTGAVGAVTVTVDGSGYTSVPSTTFTGGGTPTTTATGLALLGVQLAPATTFTANTTTTCTAPVVTFSGGGATTQATATAQETGGVITGITVTNPGVGYTSVPTVAVTPKASCGSATVTPSLGVVGVAITNGGAGYSSTPTVTLGAPATGTAATATATEGVVPFGNPYVETLDANDNVYLGSQNVQANYGAYAFYPSVQSNGAALYAPVPNATFTAPRGLGIDTLGNLWTTANNTSSIVEMNPSTGAVINFANTANGNSPFALSIDRSNNIWYSINQLFELVAPGYTAATFTTNFKYMIRSFTFDQNQNVWAASYNISGGSSYGNVLPNLGTASSPSYGTSSAPLIDAAITGNTTVGISIDSFGNAWQSSSTGLFELQPSGSPVASITLGNAGSPFTASTVLPNYNSMDGGNNVWVANNGTGGQDVIQFVTSTGAAYLYAPCYLTTGATTCVNSIQTPQRTQPDSTGSVWVTSLANGHLIQIIGPGTPSWPQSSWGYSGVEPQ